MRQFWLFNRYRKRWLTASLGGAIALGIIFLPTFQPIVLLGEQHIAPSGMAIAQNASPDESATEPAPTEGETTQGTPQPPSPLSPPGFDIDLPPEITQLFASPRSQAIEQAPVRLNGRILFRITFPGSPGDNSNSRAKDRAREIEQRLRRVATHDFDPDQLDVRWDIKNNYPVIHAAVVNDDGTMQESLGDILTVTSLDARTFWMTPELITPEAIRQQMEETAHEWSEMIEAELIQFKQQRQLDYLVRQGQLAASIVVGVLMLSYSLNHLQDKLHQQRQDLATTAKTTALLISEQVNQSDDVPADTSDLVNQEMQTRQQQDVNSLKRWLLKLGQIFIWGSAIFVILGLFPYTRWLQLAMWQALQIPGELALIAIATYLLMRLSGIFIDRSLTFLQRSPSILANNSQRRILRFSTFSSVSKSVVVLLLGLVGIFVALHVLGVNVAPLLAGAGLVGFAITFAAQNLIRDLINGVLILAEDHYGVGDVVIIGEMSGLVENMGLRITQLRNPEGQLITIPNGTITVVQNLTKEWSRVDLMVDVAHTSDIDQAIALIRQVAEDMASEPGWKQLILETPAVLGIDRLDHVGATVRIWIKTQPLKQWEVAREYRRRLKIAFDQNGIDIGVPQQAIRFSTRLDVQRSPTLTPQNQSNHHSQQDFQQHYSNGELQEDAGDPPQPTSHQVSDSDRQVG